MKQRLALPFIALLLLLPVDVKAQAYVDIVWDQMQEAFSQLVTGDYLARNYVISKLDQGGKDAWTFNFVSGSDNALIAVCDADCSDVDLRIFRGDKLVMKSTTASDLEALWFNPSRSGRYKIEVDMYQCASEPCYFGLAMFER